MYKEITGNSQIELLKIKNIDLLITSPPYYLCRCYKNSKEMKLNHKYYSDELGGEATPYEYIRNLTDILNKVHLSREGSMIINIGDTKSIKDVVDPNNYYPDILKNEMCCIPDLLIFEMKKLGWIVHNISIWHKPNSLPNLYRSMPNASKEYLIWFKKCSKPKWNYKNVRQPSNTKAGTTIKFGNKKYNNKQKEIISDGKRCLQDVFIFPNTSNKSNHCAPFCENLVQIYIEGCTDENDLVVDCFAGTHTTGRVAKKLNRNYVGIDIIDWNKK